MGNNYGIIDRIEQAGYIISASGEVFNKNGTIKKGCLNKVTGYVLMGFFIDGVSFTVSEHRIIALKLIPNPNNYNQVNHINGIKTDNRIENLEWCSRSYNISHAYKTGLMENNRAASRRNVVIASEVAHVKRRKKVIDTSTGHIYESAIEAAQKLNLTYTYVTIRLSGNYRNDTTLMYLSSFNETFKTDNDETTD